MTLRRAAVAASLLLPVGAAAGPAPAAPVVPAHAPAPAPAPEPAPGHEAAPADGHLPPATPPAHGHPPTAPAHGHPPEPDPPPAHGHPPEPGPPPAHGHPPEPATPPAHGHPPTAPAHGHPPEPDPPPDPADPPAAAPDAPDADATRPAVGGVIWAAVRRLFLAIVVIWGVRHATEAARRRLPQVAEELAAVRFFATALAVVLCVTSLLAVAQWVDPLAPWVLLGLAALPLAAVGVRWLPRYLGGLWYGLRIREEDVGALQVAGVTGRLTTIGVTRARVVHADGGWTLIPIAALSGAAVTGQANATVVRIALAPGQAPEPVFTAAVLSPWRDASCPVRVATEDGRKVVVAAAWSVEAARRLERQALAASAPHEG